MTSNFLLFQNDENWNNYSSQIRNKLLKEPIDSDNLLSNVFFSKENFDLINKQIIITVFKKSNKEYLVGNQRYDHLTLVMRFVLNEYGRHLPYDIDKQIKELNTLVVDNVVPDIITNVEQRINYLDEISKPITPIALPVNVNYNNKTLKMNSLF